MKMKMIGISVVPWARWSAEPNRRMIVRLMVLISFFELPDGLYASTEFYTIFKYDGHDGFFELPQKDVSRFYPNEPWLIADKTFWHSQMESAKALAIPRQMFCARKFKNHLIYCIRDISIEHHNDTYLCDFYNGTAGKLQLSENSVPRDIKIDENNKLYVLCNQTKIEKPGYTVQVYSSSDLISWCRVTQFYSETFARSFEILNGDLYFGCGDIQGKTDSTISNCTGNIYRIKAARQENIPVSM